MLTLPGQGQARKLRPADPPVSALIFVAANAIDCCGLDRMEFAVDSLEPAIPTVLRREGAGEREILVWWILHALAGGGGFDRACAWLRAEASRAVQGPFALCAGAVIAFGAPAGPIV